MRKSVRKIHILVLFVLLTLSAALLCACDEPSAPGQTGTTVETLPPSADLPTDGPRTDETTPGKTVFSETSSGRTTAPDTPSEPATPTTPSDLTAPATPTEPSTTLTTPTPHVHCFGDWAIESEPTCTEPGARYRACLCGETERETLPATGHTPAVLPAIAPACTEPGKTEGSVCAVCGEILSAQEPVPATGHTPEPLPGYAPTCTENGLTDGERCAVCGEILTAPQTLPATGHTAVAGQALQPTSTKAGHTAGSSCAVCGAVLEKQKDLPAKGTDWILEDGAFKLLLIGNSFSQDASNFLFEGDTNQLLNDLKALLGRDVEIVIGICQSGSKTMAWHASMAAANRSIYSFHVISSSDPVWRTTKDKDSSSAYALAYTNWDIVSLQPYKEGDIGMYPGDQYENEIEERFYPLSSSLSYMLDHVQLYAPQSDVYCYMQWATSSDSTLNVSLKKYNAFRDYFPTVLTFRGDRGKVFEDIIPVGLAIQNARSTYFALFDYHTDDTSKSQILSYDAQCGLLRDGLHLTYNVGRYIASATFALTVVPESLRIRNAELPGIRNSEGIGRLPDEYTAVAKAAVNAALTSWRAGSLEVTQLTDYTEDPSSRAAGKLAENPLVVPDADGEEALLASLKQEAQSRLPDGCTVTAVRISGGYPPPEGAKSFFVYVTVRCGYGETTVRVQAWTE